MFLSGVFKKMNRGLVGNASFRRLNSQSSTPRYRLYKLGHFHKEASRDVDARNLSKPDDELMCRICRLGSDKSKEELISPCACKGTLAYIHRTCLEKWLKRSGITYCELCRYTYTIKVIQRYSKLNSIRKWFTDEDSIDDTQDLIVDTVLSLTFLPIVFICCYSFITMYSEVPRLNIRNFMSTNDFETKQKLWVIFMLGCVNFAIVGSYSCWLALRSAHYHRKWTNWVRRHGNLTVILDTGKSS